ncbi:MAG: hypothetical protein K9K63_16445 [Desulfotignum sp.]|nr:hypothetical protein [Desulfotignum sp.]MCF8089811.1 hypothetical protein [Desulfotignum sp.]MCF8138895.1 hypothetical protein [Desulfotignum sp.]
MNHNADTIVSLCISCFMSELLQDSDALAGMTSGQQALLQTVCRTAARDALELSAPVTAQQVSAAQTSETCSQECVYESRCVC